MIDQPPGTVVIGGSQAGLAVGYFLKKRHLPFVILDEHERIGNRGGRLPDRRAEASLDFKL